MPLNDYVKTLYEQRDKEVYQMHKQDFSYSKIKDKFGIDPARISRIIKKLKKLEEEKAEGIDKGQ